MYSLFAEMYPAQVHRKIGHIILCRDSQGVGVDKRLQQEALGLVELLYDAACDVNHWPIFLDELTKTIGGKSALLCLTDSLSATDNKIHT